MVQITENTALKLINVLNEKFGVEYNSTSTEDIIPYAQDMINRYAQYTIQSSIVKLGLMVVLWVFTIAIFVICKKQLSKHNTDSKINQILTFVLLIDMIFGILYLLFSTIAVPIFTIDIIKAIQIPDIVVFELLEGGMR